MERLTERRFGGIDNKDVIAGRDSKLNDAAAHLSSANDADGLDVFESHDVTTLSFVTGQ